MGILIGMDEAGYGPNLGPLVVAATAWEVAEERSEAGGRRSENDVDASISEGTLASAARPNLLGAAVCDEPGKMPGLCEIDLYRVLRSVVAKSASERRIAIADSKALYHPGLGLRQLERGIHAVMLAMGQSHRCWSALVEFCRADPDGYHRRHCWPDGHDSALPVDATADELARLGTRFERACAAAGVRPLAVRARLIFPAEFNQLVDYHGTKGAALSHVTIGLLREILGAAALRFGSLRLASASRLNEPVFVVCDKHGGRNHYAALLQHFFPDHWIEPLCEGRAESRYQWGLVESRVEIAFRTGGESFLPTALASMTAKYLRELSMRAFNSFWCARVPNLRPTAGYPLDARRFKQDIAATQRTLGIDDRTLWRSR